MTRRGRPLLMLSASLLLACAAMSARPQGSTLDAPMHPIGKTDLAPSRCAKCPVEDASRADSGRVGERTAPEYPGPRSAEPAMEPTENVGEGLPAGPLPIALPLR